MKLLKKEIRASVGYIDELDEHDQALLLKAIEARKNAQAPYSNFKVGVALRSASGVMYWGCNVERASWTQTTHAEQNAVDTMVAEEGASRISVLALAAAPASKKELFLAGAGFEKELAKFSIDQVVAPCGHCLQIIWENCFNCIDTKLISLNADGLVTVTTIGDAFPMKFGPKELGIDYSRLN